MKNTRQKWIDNAKGISILCVIAGHVTGNMTGLWNFQFVYGFHLTVFFLLSGYTLRKKPFTIEYINNKFFRLMIPYFITCLFILIMDILNSYIIYHDWSILTVTYLIGRDLIRSFFASGSITSLGIVETGTRIGAIWFLPGIFFALIIFQGLLQKTTNAKQLGIITFSLTIISYISAKFIWFPFSVQAGMFATFFVWIGYEIYENNCLEKIEWHHYICALILFLIGIYFKFAYVDYVIADFNDIVFSVIVSLSGSLLVYFISVHMERSKIISWIGKNSIYILCIHLFSLEALGIYVEKTLDRLSLIGNIRSLVLLIIEVLIPVIILGLWLAIKKEIRIFYPKFKINKMIMLEVNTSRDISIDIVKGIFIICMLVGHFSIDKTLRNIIYSCHMVVFVFVSGYFYKKSQSLMGVFCHLVRSFLFPYMAFTVGIIVLNVNYWSQEYFIITLKQYLFGMSFSQKIFTEIPTVGPVYFILMLFVIRLVYAFIDKIIDNEIYKIVLILLLSLVGMKLGQKGYWLIWSADIALWGLIFYQLGIYFRKYDFLEKAKNNDVMYFIFASIWAYMIYKGGMEIAIRNYGEYGLSLIGATSGMLIVYKLANYILNYFPFLSNILTYAGKASMLIIMIHTMLGETICDFVSGNFNPNYLPFMVITIMIQVMLAITLDFILSKVKERIHQNNLG